MAGCADEDLGKPDGGKPQGNGIVFGASASYVGDEPGKRTIYGDYDNPDNPTSQEILWVDQDRVEIYSPTSPTKKQVEYEITNLRQDDNGKAYLVSYQGQDGLQWDRSAPGQKQDFYAVYPSKASMTNQGIANQYVSFENGVLKGFIPTNQQQVISKTSEGWVATPNMDWQYMAARINGYEVPEEGVDGDINLVFKPLVTTLEITLVGPSSALAQMNIEAPENTTIMGRFSCDLTEGDWGNDGGVPTCVAEQTGTTTNYVTVNLYDDNNQPLQLEEGEEITFNVFLLPVEKLTDISIRIAGFNTASRTLELTDEVQGKVTLVPNQKTRVRIKAPNIGENETNRWLGGLNDNVLLTQLSIPGTANSFSYNYQGENYERWRTQTATIEEQWNAGIRCFELVCDENGGDVENAPLRCNRQEIGGGTEGISTFGQAVQKIWDLVQANSSEFAIIIPSYDSDTGHQPDHKGVANFANGLNDFYDSHSGYEYRTFTRELTVGEVRGSLIFIARITSEEDEGYTLPAPHQGTFVDEWGSLKDNWARRGYAVNGERVNNWGTNVNDENSVEYYMHMRTTQNYGTDQDNTAPQPDGFSLVGAPTLPTDFVHTSQRSGSSVQGRAYIQDWQRVVPRAGTYSSFTLRPGSFYLGRETTITWPFLYYHYYYWPESLTEKEGHIWDTFEASILENSQEDGGEMFYINSLDGFFVDPTIENSYKPYVAGGTWGVGLSDGGTEGNILAYANYINDYFYNRILNYGVANIYGPMNIVLMDYVYDGTAGGDRLPSTIINNNFRFPLLTSDGSTETPTPSTQADASFANGGSVWQ